MRSYISSHLLQNSTVVQADNASDMDKKPTKAKNVYMLLCQFLFFFFFFSCLMHYGNETAEDLVMTQATAIIGYRTL